uniref:Ubiquitin carboxyl-terminal hydrolase n=1 Tax=Musa acuminata subsp. malaccensis TaxID=214687 RepID=A0A804I8D9_MUSAM|nr:PREDICTED: ubiquitin carboxyl-terminal hydrolase 23-like [Musa acuminata subsp. malaccensis]
MSAGSSVANKPEGASGSVSQVEALFQRRIEFHRARKPYSSFSSPDGDFRLETLNPSSGPDRPGVSAAAAVSSRSGEGRFYEHGLDPELSFRITFRRIGAGLANLGNTCFLNSVIQCLTYTEPFAAYLQSGKHKSSCHTTGFCAMCALQNHVITALQSSGKILSPSHLVKNLRCISRNFRNSRQEDAHEYMVNLLESMHKCCLPSGVPSESPSAYERSLVHKIFGGRLRSQVKCMQCSYSSSKFDPFLDLSLEIVKADSLRKALAHFTAVEQLDGGQRQYQCQRCKEKVRALKQLTIHKAPYVLTIHLKRFGSHVPGQKIDKKVTFEPTLDLKPFVSDQHGGDLKYTLYGVLVHAGWSTHSGHYYCYVRTSSGMWHSLDDNQVRQVSEKIVLVQKAYMLFYVRDRGSTPKGSINTVCKDNISASAIGKKLIPESSSLVSSGAAQISATERKLSTSESISVKTRTDATNIQSGLVDASSPNPLHQAASTLRKNDNNALSEVPELHNNTQEVNKDSVVVKAISKASCENDSPFISQSGRSDSEKCHRSGGSNGVVKSGVLVAQPKNSGSPDPESQKNEIKLIKERDTAKSGDAANAILKKNDVLCKKVSYIHEENGKTRLLSQSSHTNGFIRKEANATTCHNERCSLNLQSCKENIPEQGKPILVDISKGLGTPSSFLQKEACGEGKIDKQMGLKPKKLAKYPQVGLHFGRNHLFLSSLNLRLINKFKKRKKPHLSSKNSPKDNNIILDSHGASTSEATENVSVHKHSHLEHSCSGLIKADNAKNVKWRKYSNSESLNVAGGGEELNSIKNAVLDPNQLPRTCLDTAEKVLSSRVIDADDKLLPRHDFLKLMMGGLKETTVPRWDDTELPKLELNGPESSRRTSIGYVLDEWDEEYDQGKRKKLRKCQPSFAGSNLFQETANLKAWKKSNSKPDETRFGNQPFRI